MSIPALDSSFGPSHDVLLAVSPDFCRNPALAITAKSSSRLSMAPFLLSIVMLKGCMPERSAFLHFPHLRQLIFLSSSSDWKCLPLTLLILVNDFRGRESKCVFAFTPPSSTLGTHQTPDEGSKDH